MAASRPEIVAAVEAHALAHYEDGGWDVVVECWGPEEISEFLWGEFASVRPRSVNGAIRRMEDIVSIWADRQADARNSAF